MSYMTYYPFFIKNHTAKSKKFIHISKIATNFSTRQGKRGKDDCHNNNFIRKPGLGLAIGKVN